jgi:SAM-dependent methyltransferase
MKLNLCCGANIFPGWVNIDATDVEQDYVRHLREAPPGFVWPPAQQPLASWVQAGKSLNIWRHDVRKGLPFKTGSVDAIYVGQAIEHFNRRTEAPAFLRECCRVLKQHGVIKLTTPDLSKLLKAYEMDCMDEFAEEQPGFYAGAEPEDQLAYLLYGASGPDCTRENYEGHFHCYTPRSLGALLQECGFDVRTKDSAEFADTVDFGMSHSFAIEGVKP